MVLDAPKPADQPVESAREKATKQGDQKASHRPIGVSLERATRASLQRTTRTVWTEKEPPLKSLSQKPVKDLIKSFGKRWLEPKGIRQKEAFQLDAKRLLKSVSKAQENPSHEKTEKAFLKDVEHEGSIVALHPFLRERWRYYYLTVSCKLTILFLQ